MPKVSFILPAFKKRFLKDAIASILAQTYKDYELVVVDDASPENLKEIVDQFSDKRLSYHRNEQNLGGHSLVAAWTHAMSYAAGEFCVLASDDDLYKEDFLAEMIALSEKYPETDVFHCRAGNIDKMGNIINYGDFRSEYESCLEMVYARTVKRLLSTMPDFMFRISRWKEIGGFIDFPVAFFSDDATTILMAQKNGCVHSNKLLFLFRDSGINITGSSGNIVPKVKAALEYTEWCRDLLKQIEPASEDENIFKNYVSNKYYQTQYNFILSLVANASWQEFFSIVTLLNQSDRFIRNLVIKKKIRMCIDKIISFFSLNRL